MFDPSTLFDGEIESDAALLEAILIEFQERHDKILRLEHSRDIDVLRNELKSIAGDPYDDGSVEYPEGYPENDDEYMDRAAKDMYRVMITSSHGDLLIETENGDVLLFRQDDPSDDTGDFGAIKRFDVREWEDFYGKRLSDLDAVDILDIGFWNLDGTYTPAVETVRAQIRRDLRSLEK